MNLKNTVICGITAILSTMLARFIQYIFFEQYQAQHSSLLFGLRIIFIAITTVGVMAVIEFFVARKKQNK